LSEKNLLKFVKALQDGTVVMREKIKLNVKPLLGSIIFAIILWVMVATDKTYSYQIKVPIEIVRLAPHVTLLEPPPEYAVIEVQGKGRALISAWFYDVAFRLEFPNLTKSRKIVLADYLTFLDMPTTFGLAVVDVIDPVSFELKIGPELTSPVPIQLDGRIQPQDGYALMDYTFSRDSAIVSGPASKVAKLASIKTEQVNFVGQKSSFSEVVQLVNPQPGIFKITPQSVRLDLDIQRLVERIIREIPVRIRKVPPDLEVTAIPAKFALKVKGGEQIIAALDTSQIIAEIDFKSYYRPDREKYAVSIITPEKVSWIESYPRVFSLQVKKK
jgi:YbbR domain-containing protein